MKANDFLQANPTFDVQDLEFLKVDGKYDDNMLETWHKQINSNVFANTSRMIELRAV